MAEVSVIIPTYNRLRYLNDTLACLLNQTRTPDEIVIIDDHSNDGTYQYIRDNYSDPVQIFRNKKEGPGAARNLGFQLSKGKYIKFFDSDDLLTRNGIEDQWETLRGSNADVVYSPYVKISIGDNQIEQKDSIMHHYPIPSNQNLRKLMIRGLFIPIPSLMIKRDILREGIRWNEDVYTYEDWDFLWNLSKKMKKIVHSNNSAFLYRQHGIQSTHGTVTNHQMDNEKLTVFIPILNQVRRDKSFGKMEFYNFLSNFIFDLDQKEVNKRYKFIFTYRNRLLCHILILIKKVNSKIRFFLNRTYWPGYYGTTNEINEFERIIKNI